MNSPYADYLWMHKKLITLINEGKGDSQEADDLRDQMDKPWYAMNQEERFKFTGNDVS